MVFAFSGICSSELYLVIFCLQVVHAFDYVFVKFSGDHEEDIALGEVADALGGNLQAIVAEVRLESESYLLHCF